MKPRDTYRELVMHTLQGQRLKPRFVPICINFSSNDPKGGLIYL